MPMTGGTRMLRARRKDCNVKPNRRLDRKSSRGMLYENEELRMRTITINAEVEQGQHALKKLRRENEQLRREMWCLRDEYDKMEKLLRKREEGEESDQENSDSDDNCSRTDESDEEKRTKQSPDQKNMDPENTENFQSEFGNAANVRTFDGLSVIDEQTEETQTTESAAGYGTLSRGNSAVRTFNQPVSMQDEVCGIPELPLYSYPGEHYGAKTNVRKKGVYGVENGAVLPDEWAAVAPCDTYDARPPSPYPYNGSLRPSYQKRFQVLQELPLMPQTPSNAIGDNGWIFPDPSKLLELPSYNAYPNDTNFVENYTPEKPVADILPPKFGYDIIQDRAGPDVFMTDGYPPVNKEVSGDSTKEIQKIIGESTEETAIDNVEAEIDKIEISQKSEIDPTVKKMKTLTKSAVSRSGVGLTTITGGFQETLDPGKLTMDEAVDKSDNGIPKHVQQLVPCQNSNGQDVRETIENFPEACNPPTVEMPQSGSSKYQTKLLVTLKTPGGGRSEGRVGKKVPGPVPPKNFPYRYGIKPEYTMRFQTFPSPGFQPHPRTSVTSGHYLNQYGGLRMPGLSESLPRLPTVLPKNEIGLNPPNIPDELHKELDVLPDEESLSVPITQSLGKPVKIPPAPPPRTSSCSKPIIPAPPVGVTTFHHRMLRKGKPLQAQDTFDMSEPVMYNPLLLSQPIATSSPTISLKGTKYGVNNSTENLYSPRFRKQSNNDESSLEELSKQKLKLKEELNRSDVPKLNKSVSSPSFGSFRTLRRRPSEVLTASVENIFVEKIPEAISLSEKPTKSTKGQSAQNSVSSSSGLDSPAKSDRRKRRVSIQFKKKHSQTESKHLGNEVGNKDSTDSRRDSVAPILSAKTGTHRLKGKNDETDATTSERERTNSVSSRTSSVVVGGGRRKFSISSNRTYLNDEKIPWCGCWGNGCV